MWAFSRRKRADKVRVTGVVISVIFNICMLGVFKYSGFL